MLRPHEKGFDTDHPKLTTKVEKETANEQPREIIWEENL